MGQKRVLKPFWDRKCRCFKNRAPAFIKPSFLNVGGSVWELKIDPKKLQERIKQSLSVLCPWTRARRNLGTTSCASRTSCQASTAAICVHSACRKPPPRSEHARFSPARSVCNARTTCHPAAGEFCPPRRSPLEAPYPFRRADEREVQRGRM